MIGDYIEPLLEIQRMAKELERLTLKKDFASAAQVADALKVECETLSDWCSRNTNGS